jgi:hypothetical protein
VETAQDGPDAGDTGEREAKARGKQILDSDSSEQ